MLKLDVCKCQFSDWYNDFKDVTFDSEMLELPQEVVDYILADGLILPEGCEELMSRSGLEGDSDDEINWDDNSTEDSKAPSFPEMNKRMLEAIGKLEGHVFPKLNWSAPKDASWIALDRTLRCTCPRDIYLLLKSSNFITHDLTDPFTHCDDSETEGIDINYQLILRTWQDLNPAGEFRCFVKNNKLIGISQRQHRAFFPSIPAEKDDIMTDLTEFYSTKIYGKFALANYVFDVYREKKTKISLVDFNPYGPVTDGLLYNWSELLSDKPMTAESPDSKPTLRFVEAEGQVQSTGYGCYSVPQDFVHLSSGEDPSKLKDFLNMKIQNGEDSTSEEDEPT